MRSSVALTIVVVIVITIIVAVVWWTTLLLYRRWKNSPYKGLPRRQRHELIRRQYELELRKQEQDERERVRRYIDDPSDPNSSHWKGLS